MIWGLLIDIWGLLIDIWGLLIDNSIERIRDLLIKQIWNKLVGCFLKFIESWTEAQKCACITVDWTKLEYIIVHTCWLYCPTKLSGLYRTVSTFVPCSSKFNRLIWTNVGWYEVRKSTSKMFSILHIVAVVHVLYTTTTTTTTTTNNNNNSFI